jgi:outer membrane receptor protein involved in Fe transport
MVTSNPLHQVDIGARGVMLPNDSGDHVLLLINGHAVNEPLFGTARFERGAGVPVEMIDHVEVILGPGSVLYGSNAMLGVINIITKRAKDWNGVHVIGETEIGKSYRAAAGAGFEFNLFGRPSEVTVGLEYYKQSGPAYYFGPQFAGIDAASGDPLIYTRDPHVNVPPGSWGGLADRAYYAEVPSALVRFASGNLEVNLHAKSYNRATPYRSRFTNPIRDFNDADSYETERQIWGDIRYHATVSPVVGITARAYGDSFDYLDKFNVSEVSGCLFDNVGTCGYRLQGISRWAGSELQGSFDWLKNGNLITLVGVDGRVRQVGSKADTSNYQTGAPLASSNGVIDHGDAVLGAYLQQTWQPTAWLGLNGGARFDTETRYPGRVSPRVAASAGVWKGGTLKGVYAEAFRSPSWIETDFQNQLQAHSDALKPETVRSVEASFEQRFGTQRMLVGAFRSWWNDLVELHVLTRDEQIELAREGKLDLLHNFGAAQFRNVSSIDNYGFNAAYEGSLGSTQQLKYGANLTAAIARRNEPGQPSLPLVVAPQLFGNARVAYDLPGDLPVLALAAHYLGKRPVDRAYDGGWGQLYEASSLVEMRATVSGPVPLVKGLSYRASANMLFAPCPANLVGSHDACGPYVVGPGQARDNVTIRPELVPQDTFRVTVGLQYDLP